MKNDLLSRFGNINHRVNSAINDLKLNKGIILIDNRNRENEGDLVFSCETMTVKQMAFTIHHGSGIVCVCITNEKRKQLDLPMMVKKNTSTYNTGFTISIEAAKGISTGVSAQDRLQTIKTIIPQSAKSSDLKYPGHVFPLCAHEGGVFCRNGHTEASIELVTLAGFSPMSVICELTNKDGSMKKTKEIVQFAQIHQISVLTIDDLLSYLKNKKG
ncbi:3,4-dihydroxy-2-butanone-4-phosphate synthase [Buchnera aphidicola]|uniref:3,4-dihydroxy-2-butanone-4-phosphate synthase n=1 Tax=Buchnera aphidicola TaxID=9 RepID=UPI0031B877F1